MCYHIYLEKIFQQHCGLIGWSDEVALPFHFVNGLHTEISNWFKKYLLEWEVTPDRITAFSRTFWEDIRTEEEPVSSKWMTLYLQLFQDICSNFSFSCVSVCGAGFTYVFVYVGTSVYTNSGVRMYPHTCGGPRLNSGVFFHHSSPLPWVRVSQLSQSLH